MEGKGSETLRRKRWRREALGDGLLMELCFSFEKTSLMRPICAGFCELNFCSLNGKVYGSFGFCCMDSDEFVILGDKMGARFSNVTNSAEFKR